jgi:hypothetical protein
LKYDLEIASAEISGLVILMVSDMAECLFDKVGCVQRQRNTPFYEFPLWCCDVWCVALRFTHPTRQ